MSVKYPTYYRFSITIDNDMFISHFLLKNLNLFFYDFFKLIYIEVWLCV